MIFRHSGSVGDVVAGLPTLKALLTRAGVDRGTLLLQVDQPARLPAWLNHPAGAVRLNRDFALKLLPLLEVQPYLEAVGIYQGQPVDIDLDAFRATGFNFCMGNLARYYCHAFPVCPVLWEAWLAVDPDPAFAGTILVNRTARYRNPAISYDFLKKLPGVQFIGLADEAGEFRQVPHARTKDFLAAARAIKACRLFVGNQSACFWLAEALKVPRVLEVCPYVPNVSPAGPGGYEAFSQAVMEEVVGDLLK
jgi:hypothetical protein